MFYVFAMCFFLFLFTVQESIQVFEGCTGPLLICKELVALRGFFPNKNFRIM